MITFARIVTSVSPPPHGAFGLSLGEYVSVIDRATASLDRAIATGNGALADHARIYLAGAGRIMIGRDVFLSTDAPRLARQIGTSTATWSAVSQRLHALDRLLHTAPIRPAEPDAVQRLRSILADPRFHPHQDWRGRLDAWLGDQLSRFFQWVAEQLARVLGPFAHPGGAINISALPFAVLFLVAVAGAVYLLAHASMSRGVRTVIQMDDDEPATVSAARRRLSEAEAEGDYRSGLRFLFLAVLLDLQARKFIQLEPGATNRDYLRRLRSQTPSFERFGAPLAELTDAFERTWYGQMQVDADLFQRCQELARAVSAHAGRSVAA